MNIQVEICVESSAFSHAAAQAGADRLEVCDRLDLDGLTPQPQIVESALATNASVVVMLRDRIDFFAGDDGATSLLGPLRDFASLGVQGVVFGFLQADGHLDWDSNRRLLEAAVRALSQVEGDGQPISRSFAARSPAAIYVVVEVTLKSRGGVDLKCLLYVGED